MELKSIIPLLLGLFSGSLVNYLSDVLPVSRHLSAPVCLRCQNPYRLQDYLLLRNCASCRQRRGIRAFIVQAAMLLITGYLWEFPRAGIPYLLAFALLVYLVTVLVIDLEHRLIMHPISITGAILCLIIGVTLRSGRSVLEGIISTLEGGAAGFGTMFAFYYLGELYMHHMAKKRGTPADNVAMGFGDVNLSGVLGLLLGWPAILAGLFFAALTGGVAGLSLILTKKYKAHATIPYAPFLILGALFLLYL